MLSTEQDRRKANRTSHQPHDHRVGPAAVVARRQAERDAAMAAHHDGKSGRRAATSRRPTARGQDVAPQVIRAKQVLPAGWLQERLQVHLCWIARDQDRRNKMSSSTRENPTSPSCRWGGAGGAPCAPPQALARRGSLSGVPTGCCGNHLVVSIVAGMRGYQPTVHDQDRAARLNKT